MRAHPAAALFPMLPDDELAALAADIQTHGQLEPVVVHEGAILDGRNRWAACQRAGVEPRTRPWAGEHGSPTRFAIAVNVQRRHLTASQKAVVAVEALPLLEGEAARRKSEKAAEAGKRGGRGNKREPEAEARDEPQASPGKGVRNRADTLSPSAPAQRDKHPAAQDAAAVVGVSTRYVEEAKAIASARPDLAERVRQGELTLPQAKREIKEAKREERREENRAKVEATAAERKAPEPTTRWATIVADPPWSPEAAGVEDVFGRSNPQYSTMGVDEIATLAPWGRCVADLADVDAHLYLWVVNRTLQAGFRVLEQWGFRFVTVLTWCKPRIGMGNYFRNNTEHVLFGVRGSQPLKVKNVGTWFEAERGPDGHSSKPAEFYEMVERCSPGPFLELFSRRDQGGWTSWGEGS